MTASVTRTKPDTKLRVAGVYWVESIPGSCAGENQRVLDGPPTVDLSGKALTVVVKFRLERDGRVGTVIEQSSGNEYYDLSAQRAIQGAIHYRLFRLI